MEARWERRRSRLSSYFCTARAVGFSRRRKAAEPSSGMFLVWIFKISNRSSSDGTPISISRSKRPGRRSAESMDSGRFVAPMTITWPREEIPSSIVKSWATTRRSTSPVTSSRRGAIESSSSMKMTDGALASASSKISRSFCSDSP